MGWEIYIFRSSSSNNGVGFGTLYLQGCQDIIGPIPPSFLISMMQIKTKKIEKNRKE